MLSLVSFCEECDGLQRLLSLCKDSNLEWRLFWFNNEEMNQLRNDLFKKEMDHGHGVKNSMGKYSFVCIQ